MSPAFVEPVVEQEDVILLHVLAVLLQEGCWIGLFVCCTEAFALRRRKRIWVQLLKTSAVGQQMPTSIC